MAEHVIDTGDSRPILLHPYRVPHAYRDEVEGQVTEMLEEGVIEPSTSDWAAPIVLVQKKDGILRFCMDHRKLNGQSKVDPYPMPRVDELIDKLGHAKFLTTLDLARGYWQVLWQPAAGRRQLLSQHRGFTNLLSCHLGCREHQPHSRE